MKNGATERQVDQTIQRVKEPGFPPHKIPGSMRAAIGITGNQASIDPNLFALCDGPQALACEDFKPLMEQLKPLAKLMNRSL